MFQVLVQKTFEGGYTREYISGLLLAAATGGVSRESLHIEQELVLLSQLMVSDVGDMAIEEAKKLIAERGKKLQGLGKYDSQRYSLEDGVDNLCGMILLISVELEEPRIVLHSLVIYRQ